MYLSSDTSDELAESLDAPSADEASHVDLAVGLCFRVGNVESGETAVTSASGHGTALQKTGLESR